DGIRDGHVTGVQTCALPISLEEVQIAREAAGEDVADAVAVEVHKLWREADASARRQAHHLAACLTPFEAVELGRAAAADVGIKAQLALAELAHEQDHIPVALQVRHKRGGVSHVHVDGTASRLEQNWRRK